MPRSVTSKIGPSRSPARQIATLRNLGRESRGWSSGCMQQGPPHHDGPGTAPEAPVAGVGRLGFRPSRRLPRDGEALVKAMLVAVAGAIALGGSWLVAASPPAGAAPQSTSFAFSGGSVPFTVPPGVCSITFDAFGAQGGDGTVDNVARFEGAGSSGRSAQTGHTQASAAVHTAQTASGGLGGHESGTLTVTPGQTLTVSVRGHGSDGPSLIGGTGGFNGGATGGTATGPTDPFDIFAG